MDIKAGPLLSKIDSPKDLKNIDSKDLPKVCEELREYIIDNVSVFGGHFGASLGVTELSVALHYVFNTPDDQLIWDVGHQAYGHKILTGRRDEFHTNRKYGGISGFPKRSESEYDAFGVGHSSTSISAALGMAEASKQMGDHDKHHIAVIGDGAMTGGMAFEAMNHAGVSNSNLLIVLNDNCMSIDPNVGALKEYLTDITTSATYNRFRDDMWKILGKISRFGPNIQEIVAKVENSTKSFLLKQSNLFESLNIRYFGPIDGHNVNHLVDVLNDLKDMPGPKILHCLTVKGKGYTLAEKDQTKWHAPGTFDKITGAIDKKVHEKPQPPKYQDVFGHTLVDLAKEYDHVVGVTPAMPSGSSMKFLMDQMPERVYDVGIAEQHAVTFSAGLATQGVVPFCNIYSTFMQRAYDQVIHDVCLQKLPVVFCLDRAGLVGADGPTHHGAYDIPFMRCVPNLVVAAPLNEEELRNMMYTGLHYGGPFSIRYPRGTGEMPDWQTPMKAIEVGKGQQVLDGEDVAILTIGHVGNMALRAAEQLSSDYQIHAAVYDMRFVKPLDEALLHEVFGKHGEVVTVEDGTLVGGFGSAILEFAADHGYQAKVKRLGIPDAIVEHGSQQELYKECGYDVAAIVKAAAELKEKSLAQV